MVRHMRLSLRATLALSLALAAAPAAAQSTTARLRAETEERARAGVTDLLRTLCPEQCVLVSVAARVEDEAVSTAAPGFESLSGGVKVPALRGVQATITADSQLPAAFRTRLRTLVGQRLAELNAPVSVTIDSVAFPPRNAPHLEALDRRLLTPPEPPRPDRDAAPAPVPPLGQRLTEQLVPAAPLLAVLALLVLGLLVLGAMLALAVRLARPPAPAPQDAGLAAWGADPGAFAAEGEAAPAPAPAVADYPAHRVRRLERALREERAVRNAVVRDALARGDARPVALWVRELGDFLLEDLRGDAALSPAFGKLAQELGRVPAHDAGARAAALFDLEGRTLAARLTQAADSADAAFGFLHAVPPVRFALAARALSPEALEVALRFAPAPARAAALAELGEAQRVALARALGRQPEVSVAYALAVADELRAHLAESARGGAQVEALLGELVDSLPAAEQDRLLEELRRDGDARLVRTLFTESTLTESPTQVLAAGMLRLPPARLVTYLGGAEAPVRERLLAAAPARLQRELKEELQLRGPSRREDFVAARRELLAVVREELAQAGADAGGPVNGARGPETRPTPT